MVILGDSGHVWSPLMKMIVTTVTFLIVRALVVDAMPASMRCQYTTNRNMKFVRILCCYDNSNEIFLPTILKHFVCVNFEMLLKPKQVL